MVLFQLWPMLMLLVAPQAEFLGTLLFVFASSTVSSALAVGMAYAVASYATASAYLLMPDCTLPRAL